jgi:Tfp pilus assembly protein PilF
MGRLRFLILLLWIFTIVYSGCASDEEKKLSHFEKAMAYFEKGEYKSAKIEFQSAIQIDPSWVEAHQRLGETSLKLGDAREALNAYLKVAELDPDNTEAQMKLATFYLLGKKNDEAREKIDAVLAKEPNNVEALLLWSGLLAREENLPEAASVLNKAIKLSS